MRKLGLIIICGLFNACNLPNNKAILEEYMFVYYSQGFKNISTFLADSVTIIDVPNYKITYSKDQYKKIFQWDSTFKPQNSFVVIGQTDSTIDYFEDRYSIRFEFLEHTPLKMKQRIHFKQGKISVIENLEYLNFNVEKWTSNRDSLVAWTDRNHPELSGFIYDLTKEGAENYLKAIELYKNVH